MFSPKIVNLSSKSLNNKTNAQFSKFNIKTPNNISYFAKINKNPSFNVFRQYAIVTVNIPPLGDSVTEGRLGNWVAKLGDIVQVDQLVVNIETDKTVAEINAPVAGKIVEIHGKEGDTVRINDKIFAIDDAVQAPKKEEQKAAAPKEEAKSAAPKEEPKKAAAPPPAPTPAPATSVPTPGRERRERMSMMRERISQRLKDSQNTAAMLTTFQECDMSKLIELRNELKDPFLEKHKVKLGFMSAFVKASAAALSDMPIVNAVIDGGDIVYRDYIDISVAVATPKGLVTPVLRDCDKLTFADVEKEINALGEKARAGKIQLSDLTGGTFTISNGGVYGSMMGTPIINPPQSAILGMHGITERAVVVNGQIVIRPIMYLALTYDHRLIDGREAVTFLRKIKFGVEDPRRLLLDI